jgi:hypothetical protein
LVASLDGEKYVRFFPRRKKVNMGKKGKGGLFLMAIYIPTPKTKTDKSTLQKRERRETLFVENGTYWN